MIDTAPPASNSVYGREKLFWFDKINFANLVCHCGAVVNKELLERADKPSSTPGDAVLVSFFWHHFSFWPFFSFILTADPAGHALGSLCILSLSPEFYFGEGISKALDLHTGQALIRPEKKISCQDMSLLWNSWICFNVSCHYDKQHTVHHKITGVYTIQY